MVDCVQDDQLADCGQYDQVVDGVQDDQLADCVQDVQVVGGVQDVQVVDGVQDVQYAKHSPSLGSSHSGIASRPGSGGTCQELSTKNHSEIFLTFFSNILKNHLNVRLSAL